MQNQKITVPKNKLNNQSLSAKAADFIRSQIIQGKFEQGSRIVEEDLSNSLGISRACIREALHSLEVEGLVRRIRNKHTEIVKFENKDMEEVFLIRISLELLCAEACISKRTVPIDELKYQLNRIKEATQPNERNYIKRVEEDIKFHELFINASQNTRAISFWKSIRSQMLTMFYSLPEKNPDLFDLQSANNHMIIIQAFEKGDIAEVSHILKEHIMQTIRLLID
jgi:DNA-binding GntR family transcriptional regulator